MDSEKPKIESPYSHLSFPEDLTEKDKELIIRQCENQDATEDNEVLGFARAYLEAKEFALNNEELQSLTPEKLQELILSFGKLAEEGKNKKGYRTVAPFILSATLSPV